MYKHFGILLVIFQCVLCFEKFLRFIPHPKVQNRKLVYELDQYEVNIDAYTNGQILIKYIQFAIYYSMPTLNFFCYVQKLDSNSKILSAHLCKRDSLNSKEDCHQITKENDRIIFGDITFQIVYDSTIGFTASLLQDLNSLKSRSMPFDGFYYCKLKNSIGFISSNYIEIQDFQHYKIKLSSYITPLSHNEEPIPIDDIRTDSFPIFLDCGKMTRDFNSLLPKWADQNFLSPFLWSLCPGVNSGSSCYRVVSNPAMRLFTPIDDYFDYYKYPNGTVMLLGMKKSGYKDSGFICLYNTMPYKSYTIYMARSNSVWRPVTYNASENYNKPIQVLSPLKNKITIREGLYQSIRFKLYASYVANPDHRKKTTQWKKDGFFVPRDFEASAYQLVFPIEITKAQTGTYTLRVNQMDSASGFDFEYEVSVIGVPKLKNGDSYSYIVYSMDDKNVSLAVEFDGALTKKSIEINGMPIDFSSKAFDTYTKELFMQYPFLTGIQISPNFISDQNPGMIQYHASNLNKNKDAPSAKTHTVSFVAENAVGISRASFLIRVLERPEFTKYLNSYNCSENCRSIDEHIFKCSVDESKYAAEGLQVKYLWWLNKLSLNNMNEGYDQKAYIVLQNDTVTIKPIKSDNAARDGRMNSILKNATLSCSVVIFEPVKGIHNPPEAAIIYNSENYADIKQLLQAKINLQSEILARGSASWVLPLIISLIVLVILVVLILYFCLRGSGETYNVDQKERAQGYDPEKEIRDNEIFQPYERDHDNNPQHPSRLSFNDDDSVGVNSDDGELDVYDIDPGKFNEEGSFIGQYASDPRKSKATA